MYLYVHRWRLWYDVLLFHLGPGMTTSMILSGGRQDPTGQPAFTSDYMSSGEGWRKADDLVHVD